MEELRNQLIEEQDDLQIKLSILLSDIEKFLDDKDKNDTISSWHSHLLTTQYNIMCQYIDVLQKRIDDLLKQKQKQYGN